MGRGGINVEVFTRDETGKTGGKIRYENAHEFCAGEARRKKEQQKNG